MKIVVIGGTGLIGSQVVAKLRDDGHEVSAASPGSGVNTVTGEGLAAALAYADTVVDVSNSPALEGAAVKDFFEKSTRNLLAAEETAGVEHHVALSVVGTARLQDSSYFQGKIAQEMLIESGPVPYSIVHATQFFEFVKNMADGAAVDGTVHFPPVLFQPIASADVAEAVAGVAEGAPLNGMVEIGGPEQYRMDEFFRAALPMRGDRRTVVTDPDADYFGAKLDERTLVPEADATLGEIHFETWPGRDGSRR